MQNEMNDKIQSLVQNEEFMKHLLSLGSVEEMSKELEKEDIDLSPGDLRKIYELTKKKQAGELSDEELEEVAGGSFTVLITVLSVFLMFDAALTGTSIASNCER